MTLAGSHANGHATTAANGRANGQQRRPTGLLPDGRVPVVVAKPRDLVPLAVGLRDAARLLGVSDVHLKKFLGEIPHLRIGGRLLFRVASLDAWLAQRESKVDGGDPK